MIKVASIVPLKYLELTRQDDYFMALAQVVLRSDRYASFFRDRVMEGKFVLLDNGAAEQSQISVKDLIAAAELVQASEVVLPDTIGNRSDTLHKGLDAADALYGNGWQLMAVPQGSTEREWADCAAIMAGWDFVDTLGISKFYPGQPRGRALYDLMHATNPLYNGKEIHLLGATLDIQDVSSLHERYRVRGIDSAFPYYYAKKGIALPSTVAKPEQGIDFVEDDGVDHDLLRHNLTWWRATCMRP
jgi:hypothetical protein